LETAHRWVIKKRFLVYEIAVFSGVPSQRYITETPFELEVRMKLVRVFILTQIIFVIEVFYIFVLSSTDNPTTQIKWFYSISDLFLFLVSSNCSIRVENLIHIDKFTAF
jgi:hypothetical protein